MQQHLMQMQPMMAAYYPTNVTTDHIQQYLDENKSLILKIVESQNSGKLSECAENQARLQRNLMYLAAIADSQPQPSSMHSQFSSGGMMQPGTHNYLQQQQQQQQQQAQQMATQQLMAARSSSMLYGQQQQQQAQLSSYQQQQGLHSSQLGMSSGSGGSTGLHHMLQSESSPHGGGFPHDFGRANKQDIGSGMSAEGRGGSSGGDGGENLYLKASED